MTIGEGIAVAGCCWSFMWLITRYFDFIHKTNVLRAEAALKGLEVTEGWMSNRKQKMLRKEFLERHEKVINSALEHFRFWYKGLPWHKRVKLVWKILVRTF